MAFIPEDGTGLLDSNSYIDVAYADSYFSDRGNTEWASLDEAAKQGALINATDYINLRWGDQFKGTIAVEDQALLWPRLYVGNSALQMPDTLKRATAEYAVRASQGPLAPDFEYDSTGRLYTKKREEVGPIVEEVSYSAATSDIDSMYAYRTYPVPDAMMRPLLAVTGLNGRGVIRN